MKKQNIEVEGGELLLQSKEGHFAIIPAKHRQEVIDMVKDGCDDCINAYIQTLPKDSDYAEDGTVFTNPPKKVKIQNPDGSIKEYNTNDTEYRELYNKTSNWFYDKNNDTYGYANLPEVDVKPNIIKDLTPNMQYDKQDNTSTIGNKQQVTNKLGVTQQYQDLKELSDEDFNSKYQTSKHRFLYDNFPEYKKQVDKDAKKLTKKTGGIDYPETNINSKSFIGSPNLAFMNPNNLKGKAEADNEKYHMNIINSVLPIPGVNKMGKIKEVGNLINEESKTIEKMVSNAIEESANVTKRPRVYRGVYINNEIRNLPKFKGKTDEEILDIMGTTIPGDTGMRRKKQLNQTLNTTNSYNHALATINKFTDPKSFQTLPTKDLTSGDSYILEIEPYELPMLTAEQQRKLYEKHITNWRIKNNNTNIIKSEAKELNLEYLKEFGDSPAFRTEGTNVVTGNFPQFIGIEGTKIGKLLKATKVTKEDYANYLNSLPVVNPADFKNLSNFLKNKK